MFRRTGGDWSRCSVLFDWDMQWINSWFGEGMGYPGVVESQILIIMHIHLYKRYVGLGTKCMIDSFCVQFISICLNILPYVNALITDNAAYQRYSRTINAQRSKSPALLIYTVLFSSRGRYAIPFHALSIYIVIQVNFLTSFHWAVGLRF